MWRGKEEVWYTENIMTQHESKTLILTPFQQRYLRVRRGADILASLLGLIFTAPLTVVIILVQKVQNPGEAVFFSQTRVGKDEKLFALYKFRTMAAAAPGAVASQDFTDAEAYISRFRSFLRRTSMDELPQLVNILRGDMSLVGPRPLIPEEEEMHTLRREAGLCQIPPGLTGWAQINGRDSLQYPEKLALDLAYGEALGPRMDLLCLWKSISAVASCRDVR